MLTRVKKLAKKNYFHYKIEEHKNSSKKTWDVLRNLLPNKPVLHVPNSIIVDDKSISDPNVIVDKFNVHFANIGKALAFHLNCSDNNAFLLYFKSPCPFSAYLYPTSLLEIMKLINNLKLNKACGYNHISSFILKTAIQVLALPLFIMTNHCIAFGTFSN